MSEQSVPRHLGIILDGNRRWAKEHGVSPLQGHKNGVENFRRIVEAGFTSGVEYISAYVFSTENWNRSKQEVSYLMGLVNVVMSKYIDELHQQEIRIVVIGRREDLKPTLLKTIRSCEERTANNKKGTLVLCFNYGGHQEIVDMTRKIVASKASENEVNEQLIEQNLYSPEIPQIDLLIRTSGEQRLSGFMLYRAAYAELYFTKKYWPDFDESDLQEALAEYANRQRRFGS